MDTTSWVLVGIIGVSLILYFVFTFAKEIKIIQNISASLICPALGFLAFRFLLPFTPDSYHTIKLTAIAFIFISITLVTKVFFTDEKLESTKKAAGIEWILFLTSMAAWISLYKSVFVIYRVPTWINILAACSYVILFCLFFLIFVKKASLPFYILGTTALIVVSFLNYCTLLNLCFDPGKYSIIRFIGSTAVLAYVIFNLLCNSVINLKLKKLISLMILLASQVLIALSNVMVLWGQKLY